MLFMDAAIYARISKDRDGTMLGVERQIEDCRREAARRGWSVDPEHVFVDNDVSATRSKVRPEYERMLEAVRRGEVGAFVVWDMDRLSRQPREIEDVIDFADSHNLSLANVAGEIDLSTSQGRMFARMKGAQARYESDQIKRRIERQIEQKATRGEPHGPAPYGWTRIVQGTGARGGPVVQVPDPETAPIVREAAARIIRGESAISIAKDLNERGLPGPRAPWTGTTLRAMLQRKSHTGAVILRGEVVGYREGETVLSREVHDQVLAIFGDPARAKYIKGNRPVHLLAKLALCGICPEGAPSKMRANGEDYTCGRCYRVTRRRSFVNEVVETTMIARLRRGDIAARLGAGDPEAVQRATEAAAAVEARLELAADGFADGNITIEQLNRITAKLREQAAAFRAEAVKHQPSTLLSGMVGEEAESAWQAAPLDLKRRIIDTLATVTVMPAGKGKHRDLESIKIAWKA